MQLGAVHDDLTTIGLGSGDRVEVELESGETHVGTYALTFSDVSDGELLLFEDSSLQLALAVNRGSAGGLLGARVRGGCGSAPRREP